jgi:hypothetical protein
MKILTVATLIIWFRVTHVRAASAETLTVDAEYEYNDDGHRTLRFDPRTVDYKKKIMRNGIGNGKTSLQPKQQEQQQQQVSTMHPLDGRCQSTKLDETQKARLGCPPPTPPPQPSLKTVTMTDAVQESNIDDSSTTKKKNIDSSLATTGNLRQEGQSFAATGQENYNDASDNNDDTFQAQAADAEDLSVQSIHLGGESATSHSRRCQSPTLSAALKKRLKCPTTTTTTTATPAANASTTTLEANSSAEEINIKMDESESVSSLIKTPEETMAPKEYMEALSFAVNGHGPEERGRDATINATVASQNVNANDDDDVVVLTTVTATEAPSQQQQQQQLPVEPTTTATSQNVSTAAWSQSKSASANNGFDDAVVVVTKTTATTATLTQPQQKPMQSTTTSKSQNVSTAALSRNKNKTGNNVTTTKAATTVPQQQQLNATPVPEPSRGTSTTASASDTGAATRTRTKVKNLRTNDRVPADSVTTETPKNGRLSRRKFLSYVPSQWETIWIKGIREWENNSSICEQFQPTSNDSDADDEVLLRQRQQQSAHLAKYMNVLCQERFAVPHEEWCYLHDGRHHVYYNTLSHKTTGTWEIYVDQTPIVLQDVDLPKRGSHHGESFASPQKGDEDVFSKFVFLDETTGEVYEEFIEPLVSHLRFPLAQCLNNNNNNNDIQDQVSAEGLAWFSGYVMPPPSLSRFGRKFYIDVGGDRWQRLHYVARTWERQDGGEWDSIYSFANQVQESTFFRKMPDSVRDKLERQDAVVTTEPTDKDGEQFLPDFIQKETNDDDYVLLKLDKGDPATKEAIVHYLLDHVGEVHVDELIWQHNLERNYLMKTLFEAVEPQPLSDQSLSEAYDLFTQLRQKGIRAHAWI